MKPEEIVAYLSLVAIILSSFLVSRSLYRLINSLSAQLQRKNEECGNLVRDFAAYVATEKENYAGARLMMNAAEREKVRTLLDEAMEVPKKESNPEPEIDNYTVVQKG